MNKAVIVFSGGQDSTTCLIQAIAEFDEVHCITFDYNQRHRKEIDVAEDIAKTLGVTSHKIMDVSVLNELAISALTRDHIPITNDLQDNGLPSSFVPGRNILFLTLAGIYAYQLNAMTVITGVCETDFSGYPDCRNQFIKSMENAIQQGMDRHIAISTPLMWLTKAETWALANKYQQLAFIRHRTLTCYNGIIGDGCGNCPACELRNNGLALFMQDSHRITKALEAKIHDHDKKPL